MGGLRHRLDRHPGMLGCAAEGELEPKISIQGPLRSHPANPLSKGAPCGLRPTQARIFGQAIEDPELVVIEPDLQVPGWHMTM